MSPAFFSPAYFPDAIIQSSLRLLLETKTERDAIRLPQIMRHLERLDEATEAVAILLVLTPDDVRPPELEKLNDSRVVPDVVFDPGSSDRRTAG